MADEDCPVASLMSDLEAAVRRFTALDDAAGKAGNNADKTALNAAWDDLRILEARAMKTFALSDLGQTLQLMLAVVEVNTLGAMAEGKPNAGESSSRLRNTLRSLLAARDASGIPDALLEFYLGNLVENLWPPAPAGASRLH